MNNGIVRIGLVAVAAAALVVIGIVLLTGNDTGPQLSPSASQAQTQQNAPPAASATAGELDTSFGGDGKVVTSLTRRRYEWASALAIQADGKIVIAGGAGGAGSVARFTADGTLDKSFSGDGKVTSNFHTAIAKFFVEYFGVAIQTDGKIVVVGAAEPRSESGTGKRSFALARYDSDGTLDSSFGAHGRLRTAFSARRAYASGVAIQADGKIVVVGYCGLRSSPHSIQYGFALARYTSDGKLDATFGRSGKVETDFTGRGGAAYGLAIQADGKIVVVGSTSGGFTLARYDSDGTLDASFGVDGKVRTHFTASGDAGFGVAIQADGKIVATGVAGRESGHSRFALARYNSDGKLDATFGVNGKVMTAFSLKVDAAAGGRIFAGAAASGVAIQADGKIVVAGSNRRGTTSPWFGDSGFALARYNSDGTLDTSFGVDGKVETDFTAVHDKATGVAIQADGSIVAAGIANEDFKVKLALARYVGR